MPNWPTERCLRLIADVHGHAAGLRRVLADLAQLGVTRPPLLLDATPSGLVVSHQRVLVSS